MRSNAMRCCFRAVRGLRVAVRDSIAPGAAGAVSTGVDAAAGRPLPVGQSATAHTSTTSHLVCFACIRRLALQHSPQLLQSPSKVCVQSGASPHPSHMLQVTTAPPTRQAAIDSNAPDIRWQRSGRVTRGRGAGYSTVTPGLPSDRAPDDAVDAGLVDTTLSRSASC